MCSSKVPPPMTSYAPLADHRRIQLGTHKTDLDVHNRILISFWTQILISQIYLSSILRTYKVSRKLQNIYYYQEGIIMSWSKDKQDYMQNTETPQSCFTSPVLQQFLTVMNTKTYHTSVPRRAKIQFCTKHLFVFFFPLSLQKQF